jgi:PAS domain S-box-containing protein
MAGLKKSREIKKLLSEAEVLDQLGEAIIAVDNDDIIVYLNKAAAELYNVARDDAIGLKLTDLYEVLWQTPEDEQAAYASLENKDYYDGVNTHIKKNGERMPARSTVSVIRDMSGKKIGMVVVPRDRTELRRVEDALRQSEKKYRTLAEHSPLAIARWDRNLRYIFITPAIENVTGKPPEFFLGKNIEEATTAPKDLHNEHARVLNEVFATGRPQTREFSYPTPTGTKFLHWYVVPEFADDGTVETVLSFTTDITNRKQLEEKLAEERNILRGIMDNAGVMLAYFDTDFNYVAVNPAYAKAVRHSAEELIGKNFSAFLPNAEIQAIFERVRDTGESESYYYRPLQFADQPERGTTYWDFIVAPVKDEKGQVQGLISSSIETTQQKKAEDALRKSEEQNRMILESVTGGFVAFDHEWRYTYVNSAAAKMLHRTKEEILGKVHWDLYPEAKKRKFWTEFNRAVREHAPVHFEELSTVIPNVWLECHGYPTPEGLAVFFNDITERKKIENALRKSEEQNRMILESTTDGFAVFDREWRCTYVNSALARMLSKTKEEFLGQTVWDIFPAASIPEVWAELQRSVRERVPVHFERIAILLPNNWIETRVFPTSEGVVVFLTDITERKKIEEALRKSEEQNRMILESITDGFAAFDHEWRYTYVNTTAARMLNKTKEELLGRVVWEVFPDTQKRKFSTEYQRAVRERVPVHFEERSAVHPDNWIESHCYPTPDGLTVIFRNITERKRMEEEIKEYTQHLEELVKERTAKLQEAERLAAIGETAGMVGHDIRNPLQTIVGVVYLAGKELDSMPEGEAKKKLKENLETIEGQVTYMNKIVSDLQDFVRPLKPSIEEIDSQQLIRNSMSAVAVPGNIQVSTLIEGVSPKLTVDPSYMKRVLTNIITNAIQAMPKGGKLTIKAFHKDESAVITIEDTGDGIPEEVKPNIFKPLFTTKAKGQGFGLAVCKRLVEAQNGTITFESQVGKGTRFTIEIPLQTKN